MNVNPAPQKKLINGIWFEVTPATWRVGRRMFVRALRVGGPALAAFLAGAKSLAEIRSEAEKGEGGILGGVERFCSLLSDEDLDATFNELAECTRYSEDGGAHWPVLSPGAQEILFRGRHLLSIKFLLFALQVQFSDFSEFLTPPAVGNAPGAGTPPSSPG